MIDIADIPLLLKRNIGYLILGPIVLVGLALAYVLLKTPVYSASTEILLEPEGLVSVATSPDARQLPQTSQDFTVQSQAYVIMSADVLNATADKLDLDHDPALHKGSKAAEAANPEEALRNATFAWLRENVMVFRREGSFVFEVAVEHPDPNKAAAIANTIADAYITHLSSMKLKAITSTSDSLMTQASALRAQVDKAELAVENYKSQNGLVSTGQAGLVVDQQLQSLNTQITQARVDLEKARSAYALIAPLTVVDVEKNGLPEQTNGSQVLETLQIQYATISQQLAEADTTLGSSHPVRRQLQSQIASVRGQISQELERRKGILKSQYDQARATLAALETQSSTLQTENSKQGKAQVELRRLQAEAEASRTIYDAFVMRARALQEEADLKADQTRILTRAVPPTSPSGPRKIIVLAAAALFGGVLAAGIVLTLAILRGQITSGNDLVRRTGFPVLTHLPIKSRDIGHSTGRVLKGLGGRKGLAPSQHDLAISRLSFSIQQACAGQQSANLLFLSTDDHSASTLFSREIALHLQEMGEDVLFARTAADAGRDRSKASKATKPKKRSGWLGHNSKHADEDMSAVQDPQMPQSKSSLDRFLTVEHLGQQRAPGIAANLEENDNDILIIDGGAAMNNPVLPVLLRHSDGIVLVSSLGVTKTGQVDRTLAYLQPWQDRVIGNVILEAA